MGLVRRLAEGSDALGMDMIDFLLETPLLSLLHFQESDLPMGADELVDGLLQQVHGRQGYRRGFRKR